MPRERMWLMIHKGHAIAGARVLVLDFTFKDNGPYSPFRSVGNYNNLFSCIRYMEYKYE